MPSSAAPSNVLAPPWICSSVETIDVDIGSGSSTSIRASTSTSDTGGSLDHLGGDSRTLHLMSVPAHTGGRTFSHRLLLREQLREEARALEMRARALEEEVSSARREVDDLVV